MKKLVTFSPSENAEEVRNALFEAGAGILAITVNAVLMWKVPELLRQTKEANPYVGEIGQRHTGK